MSGASELETGTSDSGAAGMETRWRVVLPLLLCCYIVLAVLHALWVPVGQTGYQNAPDEAAHVAYVRTLTAGHLPDRNLAHMDTTGRSYEWHQPPLYYVWTALFSPLGERGMRLASILLGICCLLLIYRTSLLLLPDDPYLAVTATGIAALLPTHIAVSSTVNNDILLELCFSAVLTLLIASLLKGPTIKRDLWIGLTLGLGLLTKVTALVLAPVIVVALILAVLNGTPIKRVLRSFGVIGGVSFLIASWWLIRNYTLYGELLPIRAFNDAFKGTAQARPLIERYGIGFYTQSVLLASFKSFWAVFGNSQSSGLGIPLFLPEQIYIFPGLLTLAAAIGLVRLHFERKRLFSVPQIGSIQLLMTTLLLVTVSFGLFLTKYYQTQGRYLFPAMLPLCLLLGLGWRSLCPERYRRFVYGGILIFMFLLSLLFLTAVQSASL